MARAFKKWVRPRPLRIGDLVLKVSRGLIRDPRGKFRPSWSGPYFIRELTPEGAAWLMDLDGNRLSEPTNVDQLKRYYVETNGRRMGGLHFDIVMLLLLGVAPLMCRTDSVVFGLPGSISHFIWRFMDPHRLARSSLTGCSLRRGHDRYLTEPLRSTQPGPHFSTLGCHHASPSGRCVMDDFMTFVLRTCRAPDAILGHIPFRRIFMDLRRARFIPFYIVVIPGWSCLWCLDFPHHHFRGVHIRSVTRPIGVILGSSGQIGYI
ncbi:hypothetical protein CK203_096451 [Vitis vinifera]|uniref:Uncharacterized protein n=1 Tax=Vitis vinifera TaxID=29760 RepID=A0A438BWX6_VITVI|nr:hypothetical protein CK203_096451 [Vitis vinifera]